MSADLSFTPVGWEPLQAEWWPTIAASLPLPWPREAALMDLRWWRGQEAATRELGMRRVATMPGRPTLAKRWGWTDWATKDLLRSESDWADPRRVDSASPPPARRQPTASPPPADERANAEKVRDSASPPPARRQPAASRPPRARVDTDPPGTEAPSHPEIETHMSAGHGAPTVVADDDPSGADAPLLLSDAWAKHLPTTAPTVDPIADAWAAMVARTKAPAAWKLTDKRRARLRALTKEHGADALAIVTRWFASDHKHAVFIRTEHGPDTVIRPANFEKYLSMALEADTTSSTHANNPPRPKAALNPF